MNSHAHRSYRPELEAAATRLAADVISLRRGALRPSGSDAAGTADELAGAGGPAAEERAALALLGAEGLTPVEANAAFDRLEGGTYGRCEGCRQLISRRRLDVLPHARLCVRCARATAC